MDLMKSFLKSRKFWLTLVTAAVVLFGSSFSLSQEQVTLIAGAITVLVLAIMGEDVAKYVNINVPDPKKEDRIVSLVTDVANKFLDNQKAKIEADKLAGLDPVEKLEEKEKA